MMSQGLLDVVLENAHIHWQRCNDALCLVVELPAVLRLHHRLCRRILFSCGTNNQCSLDGLVHCITTFELELLWCATTVDPHSIIATASAVAKDGCNAVGDQALHISFAKVS